MSDPFAWEGVEGPAAFDPMNQIVPNLWLGNIASATNTERLKEKNIHSIVSVLPGKLYIDEVCLQHNSSMF